MYKILKKGPAGKQKCVRKVLGLPGKKKPLKNINFNEMAVNLTKPTSAIATMGESNNTAQQQQEERPHSSILAMHAQPQRRPLMERQQELLNEEAYILPTASGPEPSECQNVVDDSNIVLDLGMIMPALNALQEWVIKIDAKLDLLIGSGKCDEATLNETKKFEVIGSVQELEKFNEELKLNPGSTSLFVPYFHSLCDKKTFASKPTPGECALSFWVDFIFTRQLFTQCSWAGGSRDKNVTKTAFKKFEHVITFLLDLARTVDACFTLVATQDFLKSLLQYAKRRNATEPLRRSAPKNRPRSNRAIDVCGTSASPGAILSPELIPPPVVVMSSVKPENQNAEENQTSSQPLKYSRAKRTKIMLQRENKARAPLQM